MLTWQACSASRPPPLAGIIRQLTTTWASIPTAGFEPAPTRLSTWCLCQLGYVMGCGARDAAAERQRASPKSRPRCGEFPDDRPLT